MAHSSTADVTALHDIIINNEDWLIDRILFYARRQGFNHYAPTLRQAWQQSIQGLSRSVLKALDRGLGDMELKAEENYAADPLTRFGIIEANRHRERGVSLSMFLGLLKYYRQCYMDLIQQELTEPSSNAPCALLIKRIFDRIEIGLCTAWHAPDKDNGLADLQQANLAITNEKNRYLTIFESLQSPAAVMDRENRIDVCNHAWKTLFGGSVAPGDGNCTDSRCPEAAWLAKEVERFINGGEDEAVLEKQATTACGKRHLSIRIKRMLDVSQKFKGCVIILDDVTLQKQAEEASRNSDRLHGALELAGAVCHDLNQPLMAISGYAEILMMDCPEDAPQYAKLQKIVRQVNKLGDITKKLMHVTRYETKTYMDQQIIDIEKASGGA